MNRYTVREEFFGALVYDKVDDNYLAFDMELSNALKMELEDIQRNEELYQLLVEEEFIKDDHKNYVIYTNDYEGEVLSSPARIHFYYTNSTIF